MRKLGALALLAAALLFAGYPSPEPALKPSPTATPTVAAPPEAANAISEIFDFRGIRDLTITDRGQTITLFSGA